MDKGVVVTVFVTAIATAIATATATPAQLRANGGGAARYDTQLLQGRVANAGLQWLPAALRQRLSIHSGAFRSAWRHFVVCRRYSPGRGAQRAQVTMLCTCEGTDDPYFRHLT